MIKQKHPLIKNQYFLESKNAQKCKQKIHVCSQLNIIQKFKTRLHQRQYIINFPILQPLPIMKKNIKNIYDVLPKHKKIIDTGYNRMPHYVFDEAETQKIEIQHLPPESFRDRIAFKAIQGIRKSYDYLTSYDPQNMTKAKWIKRCLILETVAGVPGMVGGMARHLRSLRMFERDQGWIHHLLEEADNERFHLFIFLNLKQPKIWERLFIISLQGIFFNSFFLAYLMNPKFCHRFVGYLQEEAVKTYTAMLKDIENPEGILHDWNQLEAPQEAIDYYQLAQDATYRDVILSIRADEACHRQTNHYLASVEQDYEIPEEPVEAINHEDEEVKNSKK